MSGTIAAALTLASTPAPARQVGVAYSQANSASGGTAPYAYSISAGALPAGLTLNAGTGAVSGTPTTAGAFSYTVRVTDAVAAAATQTVSGTISSAVALASSPSAAAQVGVAYSQSNIASGGTAPYSYAITAGALPAGVSLNTGTGLVSGTPTAAGAFSYTVTSTDAVGGTAAQTVSGTIASAVSLASSPAAAAEVGVAYSQSNVASGGTPPYAYSISAGTLPAGLSLNAGTGLVSGTPTTAGAFSYTVRVTDAATATAAQTISGTIASAVSLTSSSSASTQVGVAYSQTNVASGGTSPYAYAVSAGALPAGVSLNAATGLVSGTPTTAGAFSYTIRVTDAVGSIATQATTGTIAAAGAALSLAAGAPGATEVGVAYSQSNAASGGTSPYAYSISAGTLPAGLSLNAGTGLVSGSPATAGAFSYTVRVTDAVTGIATQTLSGTVASAVSLAASPSASTQVGVAYSQANVASGGTSPYAYAVSAGALPAGVSLNAATGLVSGTPTTAGAFSYTIRVTDAVGSIATLTTGGTIAAAGAPLSLVSGTAGASEVGVAYSQSNVASGGTSPYTYAISAGALPASLTLNAATGLVSGTPTTAGAFSYTVRVTDAVAATATQTVSGTIASAVSLASAPSAATQVGVAYSQANVASGGTTPYAYAVSAGALPAGLSLNGATGLVSGVPTTAGGFTYTIRVTDAVGSIATQATSGTIAAAAAALSLAAGAPGATEVGVAYSQSNVASGGTSPYSYSISAGVLPAGLTLNAATGLVSGTPTTAGVFGYTVRVTDAVATTATQTVSGTVSSAVSLASSPPVSTQVGVAYSQSNVASGGTSPYAYSISAGALPAGLTLNAGTGLVSGTPTAGGAFSYAIRVTDAAAATATQSSSGTINSALAIVSAPIAPAPVIGQPFTQTNSASGGTVPRTYSIASGALPAGVTLDAATGTVSGMPTVAGPFSYAIRVSDAAGATATGATIASTVAAPAALALSPATIAPASVGAFINQPFVVSGGTAPYSFSVASGTLPPGLVLDAATGTVSGTPTVPGNYAWSIRAVDATGAAVTLNLTLAVRAASLRIGGAPVAYLNQPTTQAFQASGGTAPYTFALRSGALPDGLTLNADGTLTGTPTRAGVYSFILTVSDSDPAGPNRAELSYSMTVGVRPDPRLSAEVTTLLAEQAAAARRVATTQIENVRSRLRDLRSGARPPCTDAPPPANDGARSSVGNGAGGEATATSRNASGAAPAGSASLSLASCRRGESLTGWTAGAIEVGTSDAKDGANDFGFHTRGVSLGVDRRAGAELDIGVAVGLAHERGDASRSGTANTTDAASALAYLSWHPARHAFVDAVVGHSRLKMRSTRQLDDLSRLGGERTGTEWFASVAGGLRFGGPEAELTPYGRLETIRATLHSFSEDPANPQALRFERQSVPSLKLAIGLEASARRPTPWGELRPNLRVEVRHEFEHAGSAVLRYADDSAGPSYAIDAAGSSRNSISFGLGATLSLPHRWSIGANYDADYSGNTRSDRFALKLSRPF
ncbi:MAG: putative Ig domain-containing protein [Caldimonas sp.]